MDNEYWRDFIYYGVHAFEWKPPPQFLSVSNSLLPFPSLCQFAQFQYQKQAARTSTRNDDNNTNNEI